MKVVLQRVSSAKVTINNLNVGEINKGFLVFLGIAKEDTDKDIEFLVNKIANLRVFADSDEKFNLSIRDIKGSLLIVSQFTLFADTKKGNRPSFTNAAPPEIAEKLYNKFIEKCKSLSIPSETGRFAANMEITLTNDGPVTILINSKEKIN